LRINLAGQCHHAILYVVLNTLVAPVLDESSIQINTDFFAGTTSVYLAALGSAMLFFSCQRKLVDSPDFPRKRK
jgi:hypothetical protein